MIKQEGCLENWTTTTYKHTWLKICIFILYNQSNLDHFLHVGPMCFNFKDNLHHGKMGGRYFQLTRCRRSAAKCKKKSVCKLSMTPQWTERGSTRSTRNSSQIRKWRGGEKMGLSQTCHRVPMIHQMYPTKY